MQEVLQVLKPDGQITVEWLRGLGGFASVEWLALSLPDSPELRELAQERGWLEVLFRLGMELPEKGRAEALAILRGEPLPPIDDSLAKTLMSILVRRPHYLKQVTFYVFDSVPTLMAIEQNLPESFGLLQTESKNAVRAMMLFRRVEVLKRAAHKLLWIDPTMEGLDMLRQALQPGESNRTYILSTHYRLGYGGLCCVVLPALNLKEVQIPNCKRCFVHLLQHDFREEQLYYTRKDFRDLAWAYYKGPLKRYVTLDCSDGLVKIERYYLRNCALLDLKSCASASCASAGCESAGNLTCQQVRLMAEHTPSDNDLPHALRAALALGDAGRALELSKQLVKRLHKVDDFPDEYKGPVILPRVWGWSCSDGWSEKLSLMPEDLLSAVLRTLTPARIPPWIKPRFFNRETLDHVMRSVKPSDQELRRALPHMRMGLPHLVGYWCAARGYPLSFAWLKDVKMDPTVLLRKLTSVGKVVPSDSGRAAVLDLVPDLMPLEKHAQSARFWGLREVEQRLLQRLGRTPAPWPEEPTLIQTVALKLKPTKQEPSRAAKRLDKQLDRRFFQQSLSQ